MVFHFIMDTFTDELLDISSRRKEEGYFDSPGGFSDEGSSISDMYYDGSTGPVQQRFSEIDYYQIQEN